MARIALRIWSAIISTFAVMAVHSPANSAVAGASADLEGITAQRSKKPELFLERTATLSEPNINVAAHRSHSSHRSHASHASGYGTSSRTSASEPPSSSNTTDEPSSTSNNVVPSKSTNRVTPQAAANSGTTSRSGGEVKMLHLNIGSSLNCDYAWQDGDKVNILTNGKVLRFDASEVDIKKTFNK